MEKVTNANKDFYSSLLHELQIPYHSLDSNGNILFVNEAWINLFGYSREEVIGTFIGNYLSPESLAKFPQGFSCYKKEGYISGVEFEFISKSGQFKYVEINGKIEYNEQGDFKATHCMLPDITKRKEEERLKELSQKEWESIFQISSNPIVILNPEGYIIHANKAIVNASGLPLEKIIGQKCYKIFHGKDYECRVEGCPAQHIVDGEIIPCSSEMEVQAFNGTYIITCSPICDKNGKLEKIIHVATDITERKKYIELLEKSEAKFRDFAGFLPQTVYETDLNGTFTFINQNGYKMFGYEEDAIKSQYNILTVVHPDYISQAKRNIEDLITGNKQSTGDEYIVVRKDGTTFHALIYSALYYIEKKPAGIRGILVDLTPQKIIENELKEAENELKQSEEKYRLLIENQSDLVVKIDIENRFLYVSPSYCKTFGKTEEELLHNSFMPLVHEDDKKETSEIMKQLFNPPYKCNIEQRALTVNGWRWFSWSDTAVLDEHNNVIEIIGVGRDVTDTKKIQDQVRLNEEKYKSVVTNADVVSFILDKDGVFVLSEGKALRKLGLKPGQVVGISAFEVYKDLPQITDAISKALQGEIIRDELHILDIYFDILYSPVCDKNAEVNMIIGLAIDITERKKLEIELKEKNDYVESQNEEYIQLNEELIESNQLLIEAKMKAEENDKLKSAFLANLSHEIRTPMNAILGFSELMNDEDMSTEIRKSYISIIQKSGNHLLSIINDLIDVSKIETGQVVPFISKIYVKPYILDIYKTIQVTIPEDKVVDFSVFFDNITEESYIISDEVKLRQVLINLLVNAFKFTEKGYVHLYCSLKDNTLSCKVEDTGLGIDNQNFSIIFDRFRQIDNDVSIKKGGSGLGLAISKAYVEMLGGSISVESKIGKGSTFSFYLTSFSETLLKEKKVVKISKTTKSIGNNELILIAEDDDINYLYITKILSKTNYNLIRAKNGDEAIEIVRQLSDIKLILMDIKMPNTNGYEAVKVIRKINSSIPIIAQTAYALSEDENMIKESGFNSYISKPIKRDLLLELIQKYV